MLFFEFSITLVSFLAALIGLLVVLGGYFFVRKYKGGIASCISRSGCYEDSYRPLTDAIAILNEDKQLVYLNPAAEKMLGCKLRSKMGSDYKKVFSFKSLKTGDKLPIVIGSDEAKACECLLETAVNKSYSINLEYSPIYEYAGDGSNLGYLLVLKDITQQKLNESQLSSLKNYDSLTEMLKAKSFESEVKSLIEHSRKYKTRNVLVFFSVDQFQEISDSIGYSGVDNLIRVVGGVINKHVKRSVDIVGRIGSGEFAVVFRDSSLPLSIATIESILEVVEACNFTSLGQQYPTTMSAGFVIITDATTTSMRAISEASIACNVARRHGGNRLYAYKPENSEIKKLEGNIEWVVILKRALEADLFQMYAQPIHLLEESEFKKPYHHYELLIRLFDEYGNFIPPNEFLSAAEYYFMMPKVDRWVVRNVLGQLSKIPEQDPLPIFAVNLSGQSLNDPQFLEYVVNELEVSGVNPQMLCFEITEQVAVDDMELVNQFISTLKMLGSKFSLDDFGTGVSGFSYLRALDVDYLKIDGSFVKNIDKDEVSRSMVQSINQVGHIMNLKIIAEYVENEKILTVLREMGVDYGQGYHILRPSPLLEVAGHHMSPEGS